MLSSKKKKKKKEEEKKKKKKKKKKKERKAYSILINRPRVYSLKISFKGHPTSNPSVPHPPTRPRPTPRSFTSTRIGGRKNLLKEILQLPIQPKLSMLHVSRL